MTGTKMKQAFKFTICMVLVLSTLSACSFRKTVRPGPDGPPSEYVDIANLPNAVPKQEYQSEYGNPEFYVTNGKRYFVLPTSTGYSQVGIASWYGMKFHGVKTSNGEDYDAMAMTAAHKTLPLPTYAKVTNLKNGKSIVVRINDRGPYKPGRIIDLSYAAAQKLGINGTAKVRVTALEPAALPVPSVNKYDYYLQLAAFKDQNQAESFMQRFQKKTKFSNLLIKAKDQYHLVRLGPFPKALMAEKVAKKLVALGFKNTLLLQEQQTGS
jgi:rare lipoprotein A